MSFLSTLKDLSADLSLHAPKQEMLMTSVPPLEHVTIQNIGGVFQGHVPLRTRAFDIWPKEVPFDCLHCGSSCKDATPIPAVKFFEPQLNVFWV